MSKILYAHIWAYAPNMIDFGRDSWILPKFVKGKFGTSNFGTGKFGKGNFCTGKFGKG